MNINKLTKEQQLGLYEMLNNSTNNTESENVVLDELRRILSTHVYAKNVNLFFLLSPCFSKAMFPFWRKGSEFKGGWLNVVNGRDGYYLCPYNKSPKERIYLDVAN